VSDAATGPDTQEAPAGFRCGVVVLAGRANVGKSTLMNRLVGRDLSIVSEVPQTTRIPVRGVLHADGLQIVFLDTPGIHKPRHLMNEEMVRLATRAFAEADVVVVLADAAEGIGPGDRFVFERLRQAGARSLLVLNKIDRIAKERLLPMIEEASRPGLFEEIVPLSARTGENCDRLLRVLADRMPVGPPLFPPDMLTDLPQRLRVAEIVREQVFRKTREEVPHATAVLVESLDAEPGGLVRIAATIYVDKESQKAIVIGEGGRQIKAIGSDARRGLEALLGARVHLALWVKVRAGWRDDPAVLRLLGLTGG
jgi:GTP-binding protein Era